MILNALNLTSKIIQMKRNLLSLLLCFFALSTFAAIKTPTTILYDKSFKSGTTYPEILMKDGVKTQLTNEGLTISGNQGMVQLNHYYSLGERTARYHVKLSSDAVAVFRSNTGDMQLTVNMKDKTVSLNSNPKTWRQAAYLDADHEYLVEITAHYSTHTYSLTDLYTGDQTTIRLVNDGSGGSGVGAENSGMAVCGVHDYYCLALESGTSVTLKRLTVQAAACDIHLLIYGDSITEPECYYPASYFGDAWTQLVMNHVSGRAMCSGRGGCQINQVIERIQNELPYIKARYVMVTIGTNGGNTEEKLSRLVEYIIKQGATPILNNIPCNESGTQVAVNAMIEKIRQKYGIKGCLFDLATSVNHDGKEVDKTTMFHEDLSAKNGPQIYHHPNAKGARLMYLRTLIDVPEIY